MAPWNNHGHYFGDFTVDGTRFRPPLRDRKGRTIPADPDHWEEAVRAEERERAKAEKGELSARRQSFARLPFGKAAERYLEERRHGLARYSIRTEQERSRCPKAYFGTTSLTRISAESLREYIVWRKSQKPQRGDSTEISNRTVNMEVAFVRRLLKRAKRLHLVADELKALPERRDIGRALAPEEKLRLIHVAKSKPEWDNARLAMMLALNTTMRGCELRGGGSSGRM
jgi:hypothetical protein